MSPKLAIIVLIIIFVIAGFSCLVITPGNYDKCRLKTFIAVFAGLSLLITVLFYYALMQLQVTQSELLELREIQQIQGSVQNVTEKITKSTSTTPKFCAELMPLQITKPIVKSNKTPYVEKVATEYEISETIFLTFQSAILEHKFISEQDDFYTCLFLQWATSKKLRKYWELGKISFIPETQRFGDLLFKYAPRENKHSRNSYVEACKRMQCSKEYKLLFK